MKAELELQLAGVDLGDHLCLVYDEPEQILPAASLFVKQGLEKGESAFYIVDDNRMEAVAAALTEAGVDVASERERGTLRFLTAHEYCPLESFDAEEMLARFRQLGDELAAAGVPAVRAAVEMTWALTVDAPLDRLAEYEWWGNNIFEHFSGASLCMYNRRRFPASAMQRLVRSHPIVVLGDEVTPNPFYEPPEVFFAEESREERRFEWMLRQLVRAREDRLEREQIVARERIARAQAASSRRFEILAEASRVLAASLDYERTLAEVVELVVPRLADACAIEIAMEAGGVLRVPQSPPADSESVHAHSITAPIAVGDEQYGTLTLRRREPAAPPDAEDRLFAEELAHRVAGAVQLARAYRAEREARRAAEEMSAAKSRFLAVASHELRTPLNAILGYTQLLADGIGGAVGEGERKHVDRIHASAQHLLGLIGEVLHLSRIEAGGEEITVEEVDARELARDVLGLLEAEAEAAGLSCTLEIPAEPVRIRTDALKLRQILINLVSNAVKFTHEGEIRVRVRPEDGTGVSFRVSDTGVGIADGDQEKIFEPFRQSGAAAASRSSGAGLGLAVCRELARLLGGELRVESELGRGSAFTLTLPLEPEPVEPQADGRASTSEPARGGAAGSRAFSLPGS